MANVQRTPPKSTKTSRTPIKNLQTQSEPDVSAAISMSQNVNTNRSKRPRKDNSPPGQSLSLPDLQDTLASWKVEQDTHISKLLENQSSLIAKLASDIAEIKTQNTEIKSSNAEISRSNAELVHTMTFLNDKFEEMKAEIAGLKRERLEQNNYIQHLEKKIQDLKYKSRSSSIEIRNIPQAASETEANLISTVRKIGDVIGVPISETELRDTYRLPGKPAGPNTSRPLVVEFTSVQRKQKLLAAVRSYNKNKESVKDKLNTEIIGIMGQRYPVYIAELLPPSLRKLFFQAREFAKNNGFKYCWVTNGNIFLRKKEGDSHVLINSEERLQELVNKL